MNIYRVDNMNRLAGSLLRQNDRVVFLADMAEDSAIHNVELDHLRCHNRGNDYIFDIFGLDAHAFCTMNYGYASPQPASHWPVTRCGDYTALTRVVIALFDLELRFRHASRRI